MATADLTKQNPSSREEAINLGFAGYGAYVSWLKGLDSKTGMIQGGLWIEGNYLESELKIARVEPIVSSFEGEKLQHRLRACFASYVKMRSNA